MKKNMSGVAGLFLMVSTQIANAQMFKPGNKHFTIEASGGIATSNLNKKDWIGKTPGYFAGIGVKRFFLGFINTGFRINYEAGKQTNIFSEDSSQINNYSMLRSSIETSPFIRIGHIKLLEKSKNFECQVFTFFLNPTIGYSFNVGLTGSKPQPHAFHWGAGIATEYHRAGHRGLPIDVLINIGFKRFAPAAFKTEDKKYYNTSFGVDFIFIFLRSGSFFGNS